MDGLIKYCLKNALLLNLLTVVTLITGGVIAWKMNREAFPAVDFDTVTISTGYPGASPKEVELYVTNPLEKEIQTVDGIENVVSHSIENLSLIVVRIDPDLSERQKNQTVNKIQRAVDRVHNLPSEISGSPEVTQLDSGELPIIELALTGDLPYRELHRAADELIEKIKKLSDAKDPVSYGFNDKEFWVEVDPKKLKEFHISLAEIFSTLSSENLNLPGGVLKTPNGDYLVRTIGEVTTSEQIDRLVIRTNSSGVSLRIGDVGVTRSAFEESDKKFTTNGKPSVNLIIRKKASGDIIHLVNQVRSLVSEYQKKSAPPGLEVSFVNDMSVFVKNRLGVLIDNGLLGMILVTLCLLLFLSKGIALVAALGMPVALIGAIGVMHLMGMTMNLLTLFALVIVLGMLVDDAIIVAENIWQHYEMGKSPWQAALDGTAEVFWPVTATILTTIAAFSPLLMVYGIFGKFIESLPKVVIVSLVISLIEAMFILPSHAYDVLRFHHWRKKVKGLKPDAGPVTEKKNGFLNFVVGKYKTLLGVALRFRYLCLVLICMSLAGALYLHHSFMKTILFPNDGIEFFFVRGDLKPGTSLEKTELQFRPIENLVRKLIPADELRDQVTYIGLQQVDNLDPLRNRASHLGQVGVYLSPEQERARTADEIIASIRHEIEDLGKTLGFERIYFVRQRLGPPVGKPVAIRVFGVDFDRMNAATQEIMQQLAGFAGVSDITKDFQPGKDELQVYIQEDIARRSLLSTQDIASHLRATLEGHTATWVHDEGDRIPVKVRYPEAYRLSETLLEESLIMNRGGHLVPVKQVARFTKAPGVSAIRHHNGDRVVTVTADLDESLTSSSEINELVLPVLNRLELKYPGLRFERGGEYEDTSKSMESLSQAFALALALVFIILATVFKSLTQPFVVMAAIPFGVTGVIFTFYLHGLPLSFLAFVGIIGLSGVVVNDSIVLVDFINQGRKNGASAFHATLNAGVRRFRAVWLTSITTIFGLLPLAYGIGGQDAFLKPAAMALGYGLLFSTILILVFVPALYLIRLDLINLIIKAMQPLAVRIGWDLHVKN